VVLPRHGVTASPDEEVEVATPVSLEDVVDVETGPAPVRHRRRRRPRRAALGELAVGDLDVDQHHTVEDVGIALGEAFAEALGDKKGILRAGYFVMPMDETLAVAAVDLSGRVACVVDDQVNVPLVGDLQTELVTDFFDGFARGARANVHLKTMYGRSNHHKIEAIFKAFARALRGACSRDQRMRELLPSTKGLL